MAVFKTPSRINPAFSAAAPVGAECGPWQIFLRDAKKHCPERKNNSTGFGPASMRRGGRGVVMLNRIWMFLGLYAVLVAATVPLLLRVVPPNRFFGFRLPGTAASQELWYEINALGGKMFILSMVICSAVNLLFLWRGMEKALPHLGWINAGLIVLSFWIVSQVLVQYLP